MLDISAGTGKTSGTSGRFFRASRWGQYSMLTFFLGRYGSFSGQYSMLTTFPASPLPGGRPGLLAKPIFAIFRSSAERQKIRRSGGFSCPPPDFIQSSEWHPGGPAHCAAKEAVRRPTRIHRTSGVERKTHSGRRSKRFVPVVRSAAAPGKPFLPSFRQPAFSTFRR